MSLNISGQKLAKLAHLTSKYQIACCPITGITITMNIPAIPHKALEYTNPLALIENAKDIAALPYISHKALPKTILAGTLLTILHHYHLLSDQLSATQQNIYLSDCSYYILSEALHTFSSITRKNSGLLPHLSLESLSEDENKPYSKASDVITNYLASCKGILFPAPVESIRTFQTPSAIWKYKTIEHTNLTQEIKREIRDLAFFLYEDGEIKQKFYLFLKELSKNNNIIAVDKEIIDKVVDKLSLLQSLNASQLIEKITRCRKDMTVSESIFKQQLDDSFVTISSSLPTLGTKPTIAQILAAKKAKMSIADYMQSIAGEIESKDSYQEQEEEGEDNDQF